MYFHIDHDDIKNELFYKLKFSKYYVFLILNRLHILQLKYSSFKSYSVIC